MDVKEDISSGVSVRNNDGVSQGFFMLPRTDYPNNSNPNPNLNNPNTNLNNPNPKELGASNMAGCVQPVHMPGAPVGRKKMGRPRKYGPDGAPLAALSPMPISASIPLSGDYSGWKQPRARGLHTVKKAHKMEFEHLGNGDRLPSFGGANFTPHVITVHTGQDVAMKILSFSQQDSRAICVLSASGSISNVTLLQPNSSGGTLTYEGRFELLSLSGSFMPTDNGMMKSRTGGMSVSLAGPDGRVLGGGLGGLLVAASPVQVVLGSFVPGNNQENKPKKPRIDSVSPVIPAVVNPVQEGGYGTHKLNLTSPPSVNAKSTPSMNSTHDPRDLEDNNNVFSEGDCDDDFDDEDDDDDDSPLNLEISG